MKITKGKLRQIIREELNRADFVSLNEAIDADEALKMAQDAAKKVGGLPRKDMNPIVQKAKDASENIGSLLPPGPALGTGLLGLAFTQAPAASIPLAWATLSLTGVAYAKLLAHGVLARLFVGPEYKAVEKKILHVMGRLELNLKNYIEILDEQKTSQQSTEELTAEIKRYEKVLKTLRGQLYALNLHMAELIETYRDTFSGRSKKGSAEGMGDALNLAVGYFDDFLTSLLMVPRKQPITMGGKGSEPGEK